MSKFKILLKITGSISAYKSAYLISKLIQNNFEVKVVASDNALNFLGKATLEGLTHNPVYTDSFEDGNMMSHINLMKWADLIIICPATANTINRLACGIGDNLLTSLFLAFDWSKPYLIAPAMNAFMYNHPATKESLNKLKSWGVKILPVDEGYLSCGDIGEGKLLDPDLIYKEIINALESKNESSAKLNVLITSGGTRENIDGVRYLTNMSTGRTGAALADDFSLNKFNVTILRSKESIAPVQKCENLEYESFTELNESIKSLLSKNRYNAVIHLAAVSDFSPEALLIGKKKMDLPLNKKINSDSGEISISLKRNFKIARRLKSYSSNKNMKVVAFKLTNGANGKEQTAAVKKLFNESDPDFIVANDITDRTVKSVQANFKIFDRSMNFIECGTTEILSNELQKIIAGEK